MFLLSPILSLVLLLSVPLPLSLHSSEVSEQTLAASTQPAAPPAVATGATSSDNLLEAFSHTRLGELAQGKKKVTLAEMKDPSFWIDTIRDLVVAVISFIPRVLVSVVFL